MSKMGKINMVIKIIDIKKSNKYENFAFVNTVVSTQKGDNDGESNFKLLIRS